MSRLTTPITTLLLTISTLAMATESPELSLNEWELALNSGKVDELAGKYTDDAVIMPPNLEILDSQPEISDFWRSQLNTGANNFEVETIYLKVDGDTAYQTAIWSNTFTNSKGDKIDYSTDMTTVFVQQRDGSWKIRLQSWN